MTGEKKVAVREAGSVFSQDEVIERLKDAFSHDHLDVEEFENRMEKAAATRNAAELEALVADLPAIQASPAPDPDPSAPGRKIKENGSYFCVMSGITKKGRWRPPRNLNVVAVMGSLELDFTDVELPPGVTSIRVFNLMGSTEITVPPGVNVDLDGFAVMGGFEDNSNQEQLYPGAPTLKIRGIAIMGGVEVHPPKKKKRS